MIIIKFETPLARPPVCHVCCFWYRVCLTTGAWYSWQFEILIKGLQKEIQKKILCTIVLKKVSPPLMSASKYKISHNSTNVNNASYYYSDWIQSPHDFYLPPYTNDLLLVIAGSLQGRAMAERLDEFLSFINSMAWLVRCTSTFHWMTFRNYCYY